MRVVFFTVLCLTTLCLASCTRSSSQDSLLSFVPSSSYAVLAVHWPTVVKDADLRKMTKGAEIEKLFNGLGIGSETVTDFAVFGDLQNSTKGSGGLIVKGTFDSEVMVKELMSRGWGEQNLDGQEVYVNPVEGFYLTTFDSTLFVLGTPTGVRAVIGASENPEMRFTSNHAYETLSSRFEGKEYPIVMVAFPQASQDMANAALQISSTVMDIAGVGPLGELLNKIGYAKGLGCAISRKNDSFPVEVSAVMKDEDSAQFLSGALNLMKTVAAMAPRNGASREAVDAGRALQDMSIARTGEVISIQMTMARRDLFGGINP